MNREWIGIFLIMANVCINVASMELMQSMETVYKFKQPVFIIYVHHSVGLICLPFGLLLLHRDGLSLSEALQEIGMTGRRFTCYIIGLSALYKYNVLWTLAMPQVSVTLFNAISNSAFVFVLGFSMCLLDERATVGKLGSVLLTGMGVAFVILFPSGKAQQAHPTTVAGLLLSFMCAMGQAFYSVVYKVWIGRRGARPLALMLIVLGLIGLSTLLLFWPFVLGANAIGMESGTLPDRHQVPIWVGNFVLAVLSNVTLFLALCFASPLLVAVGQLLQMPGASLADYEFHDELVKWERGVGFALIFLGFFALTVAQRQVSAEVEKAEEEKNLYEPLSPESICDSPTPQP